MIESVDPLRRTNYFNFCPCGSLESLEDAAGNFTSFAYDNAGHRVQTVYPDGYVLNQNFDSLGRVTNTVDSGGISNFFWYNNQGLRYATTNSAGRVSLLAFDADDRVTNSIDVNGVNVGIAYDALGRTLTRSFPDGGVEGYGYTFGIAGATSYTNQIGNVTSFTFDPANRKIAETNALNNTTLFSFNPAGDLLTLTDGNNDKTSWGYDYYGRVTNKVNNVGTTLFLYQYDPDNRLTNRWSAAKGNTGFVYDAVGNLLHVAHPVSPAISFNYDVLNRVTNMVDAVGNTV
jgi:YD repeat-containing protein